MARKPHVFFNAVQPLWKANRLGKSWLNQFLLVLLSAFLCITLSFIFTNPAVYSAVPGGQNSSVQTQHNLVQQGKNFYDAGQFAEAVKVLQ
ncbi:hypothetical protein B7486_48620 [cyanobacterium TDX16]|nr:hypothetical protein B7486_48620 [cyanobacterium TDX16]